MMGNNLMKYKGYRAKVEFDDEDNIFVGEVIGINDIIAFHADNVTDLRQHFHDRIEDYLDACKEIGKEPEREYTGSFSVRVKPEEQRVAALCAAASNVSLNQYYGDALIAYNKKNMKLLSL